MRLDTANRMSLDPAGVPLALGCALPLALAAWVSYHWLSQRANRRVDG